MVCFQVALAALRTAISSYGSIIRENAQNTSHIGVDITAEERHEKCVKYVLISVFLIIQSGINYVVLLSLGA